jgi:hypothetical protein
VILYIKVAVYSGAVFSSAGVLGVVVMVCDKLRGTPGRLQPGHWLLTIVSIGFLLSMFTSLVQLVLTGSFSDTSGSGYVPYTASLLFSKAAMEGAFVVPFLWLAVKLREGPLWRVSAAAFGLTAIVGATYYLVYALVSSDATHYRVIQLLYSFFGLVSLATLAVLFVTVLVDLTRHRRRDGLHWLGVILTAFSCGFQVTSWLVYVIMSLIQARYT